MEFPKTVSVTDHYSKASTWIEHINKMASTPGIFKEDELVSLTGAAAVSEAILALTDAIYEVAGQHSPQHKAALYEAAVKARKEHANV